MKGIFTDSKDWDIVVWGDWHDKNGKPSKYKPKEGLKEIHITGGEGFYHYFKGEFMKAIGNWFQDLAIIKKVEKEEKRRYHKGLFYYQIGLAYKELRNEEKATKYINLAKEEDKLTYGKLANTFPASKL